MEHGPWWQRSTWYHVYPLGFLEAPTQNPTPGMPGGRVDHRLPGLIPWLDEVADLGLGGVQLGPVLESSTHGYDTADPHRVDRRLGDEDDLRELVDACHERGLRILLDGVFHHVGRAHPAFQEVLAHGRHADTADWFRIDFDGDGPDGFHYADFEGHDELVALDHGNPAVLDWAAGVAVHWLDRGIDGWRLDAAYRVPVEFWSAFAERVRTRHPDAFLVGEVIHGDYARLVRDGGLDSVTQYELWKAVWSALNDRNLFELAHTLERHRELCVTTTPWTFLGNHDTTRIASQLSDHRHLGHALALLMTLPGIPAVYAGDEQHAQGRKRHEVGGDDDVRRPPPGPPGDDAGGVRSLHRDLIAVRAANPWLARADVVVEHLTNETLVVAMRGGNALRLALNVGNDPVEVPAPQRVETVAGSPPPTLPPHGWGVWRS